MATLETLQSDARALAIEKQRLADNIGQYNLSSAQIQSQIFSTPDSNLAQLAALQNQLFDIARLRASDQSALNQITSELNSIQQQITVAQANPGTPAPTVATPVSAAEPQAVGVVEVGSVTPVPTVATPVVAPEPQFTNPTGVTSPVAVVAPTAEEIVLARLSTAIDTATQAAARENAAKEQARAQAQIAVQQGQASQGDWRVKLRLAGSADYLYRAEQPGILKPLAETDGVVFPYMPDITTNYVANYNNYDLTHSNYRGYFYQNSQVSEISITATFTAQDTFEAEYLLAVIHFFKSVTKMFYGQDTSQYRGAPPPLVFLQGLGEFQFNLAPCVVNNFNYVLPSDVDYIRARVANVDGTNLLVRRNNPAVTGAENQPSRNRLSNAGIPPGAVYTRPPPPTLGTSSPTYVPTKMQINLTLLPVQTRAQVSREFSLEQFANGSLIQRGFW